MASIPIVDDRDKRWGIIVSVIFMLLLGIYMYFFYFPIPDPRPQMIPLEADALIDDMVLEELLVEQGGAAGGGTPSDSPIAPPTPQTTNVITQEDSPVTVPKGNANQTNTTKPTNNTSSTTQTSPNPFGGGSGGGTGGGNGDTFGTDSGKEGSGGDGVGTGSGQGRIRKNEISTDEIYTSSTVTVKLILTINAEGQVVAAQCLTSGTTTTDQRIINQVMQAAKSQLEYNKEPGAGLQKVYYTVKIVPN